MNSFRTLTLAMGAIVLSGLVACGAGGDSSTAAGSGSLRLALTDAPACGFDAVKVTVQKVRVHQSASAGDGDSGWSEITLNPERRIDLLTLTNGVLAELGQTPLPSGKYTQLRLILADNSDAAPLANAVTPSGATEVALKTPSGQQSGIKANIDIDVTADKLADFVLDFDACMSVVTAGKSGQYLLKPVLTVLPRYISGVTGFVDTTLIGANASVSVQQGGGVVKATTPYLSASSVGRFLLQPVAPGSYTLVLTAPGRRTAVVTGVTVLADSVTSINSNATALNPATSASGTLAGTAPTDTLVRALQPLTAGPSIELAGHLVDASSGNYSYVLPVDAPLVAPYVALPGTLAFVADTAAAGKYTLSASLAGFPTKTSVLGSLSAGATITTNFTFP